MRKITRITLVTGAITQVVAAAPIKVPVQTEPEIRALNKGAQWKRERKNPYGRNKK